MFARVVATIIVAIAMSAPSWAAQGDFQIFQDVSKQVLRYPQFTIFDNVSAQVVDGVVTLNGKVTNWCRWGIARRVVSADRRRLRTPGTRPPLEP